MSTSKDVPAHHSTTDVSQFVLPSPIVNAAVARSQAVMRLTRRLGCTYADIVPELSSRKRKALLKRVTKHAASFACFFYPGVRLASLAESRNAACSSMFHFLVIECGLTPGTAEYWVARFANAVLHDDVDDISDAANAGCGSQTIKVRVRDHERSRAFVAARWLEGGAR